MIAQILSEEAWYSHEGWTPEMVARVDALRPLTEVPAFEEALIACFGRDHNGGPAQHSTSVNEVEFGLALLERLGLIPPA